MTTNFIRVTTSLFDQAICNSFADFNVPQKLRTVFTLTNILRTYQKHVERFSSLLDISLIQCLVARIFLSLCLLLILVIE